MGAPIEFHPDFVVGDIDLGRHIDEVTEDLAGSTAAGDGGAKPPTNDTTPAGPETARPLGPGEMLSRHLNGAYGALPEVDRDGMLKIAVVADKKNEPPTTPKGGEMFEEAMRAFGPSVKGIRGNWLGTGTMTENLIHSKPR
jgi:hypothetical protein